jgi:hypothetical protein
MARGPGPGGNGAITVLSVSKHFGPWLHEFLSLESKAPSFDRCDCVMLGFMTL